MKKIKTVCGECIRSNYLFNDFVDDLFELKSNNIKNEKLILNIIWGYYVRRQKKKLHTNLQQEYLKIEIFKYLKINKTIKIIKTKQSK